MPVPGVAGGRVPRHHEGPVAGRQQQGLARQGGQPRVVTGCGRSSPAAYGRQELGPHRRVVGRQVGDRRTGPQLQVLAVPPRPDRQVDGTRGGAALGRDLGQRREPDTRLGQHPQRVPQELRTLVPPVAEELGVPCDDGQRLLAGGRSAPAAGRGPQRRSVRRPDAPGRMRPSGRRAPSRPPSATSRGRAGSPTRRRGGGSRGSPRRPGSRTGTTTPGRSARRSRPTTATSPQSPTRSVLPPPATSVASSTITWSTPLADSSRSRPGPTAHSGSQAPLGRRPSRTAVSSRPLVRASRASGSGSSGSTGCVAGPPSSSTAPASTSGRSAAEPPCRQVDSKVSSARAAARCSRAAMSPQVPVGAGPGGELVRPQLPPAEPPVVLAQAVGVVELRREHRRDAEREQVAAALGGEAAEHLDERQVGRRPRLVQPLLAHRPGAVPGDPRQVGVQDDAQRPDGGWRWCPCHGRVARSSRSRQPSVGPTTKSSAATDRTVRARSSSQRSYVVSSWAATSPPRARGVGPRRSAGSRGAARRG